MLIKLPIISDNKVIFTLFKLVKYDTYYLLSLLNNNDCNFIYNTEKPIHDTNLIKILLLNDITGYDFYNIFVPLKLFIIDNQLISIYFFITYFNPQYLDNYQSYSKFDFFYCLNIILKSNNIQLMKQENYIKYYNNIFEIINSEYLLLNNNNKYNKDFWEIINLLLNVGLFKLWLNKQNITNIKISKKINNITNIIKNINYSINYSDKYTYNQHMLNKNNNEILLSDLIINNNYYLLIDNKYLLVKIISKNNNLISLYNFNNYVDYNKYKWYKYIPDIIINEKYIYYYLYFNNDTLYNLINKYNNKINIIDDIIKYFNNNQLKSQLYSFILENNNNDELLTDIHIIKSNSYNIDFFKLICLKYENNFIPILDSLFINYTYPIKYNKRELDVVFDNIIYISLLNINNILELNGEKIFINHKINIPNKLKLLYFNILKTFYQIINKNEDAIKYIYDSMHVQFIKTFLFSNSISLELFKSKISTDDFELFKKKLLINFTIYDIIERINWNNINKKLDYLKFLLNNRNNLLFFDKLNKNIIPNNFDTRIKNIIINPFYMFKYLKREIDIIKWIYVLENKYDELYYYPILINNDDIKILAKIIYYLLNIKEQNLNDKYYKKLINCSFNNQNIILENNKINLKIREKFNFIKCNINLGILAKHIIFQNNYIEFNDDNDEINVLKNELNIIKNKYLKYKKKYYNIKINIK